MIYFSRLSLFAFNLSCGFLSFSAISTVEWRCCLLAVTLFQINCIFICFWFHSAPPVFTTRPKTQIVELGKEAIFECEANGYPKPTTYYSIEGNRTLMFPGYKHDRIEVTQTPEGRLLLSIQNVQRTDAGKIIVCSAVNSVGSTSTRVVVTINTQEERPPPIIVQGPANQTLPIKSVATLPCKTIGGPV